MVCAYIQLLCPQLQKKLEGNIASGLFVRPSVTFFDALHNFRTVNATVLKFLMKKKLIRIFFFLTGLRPFSELWPFEKIRMQSCQQNISKTIEARALKLDEYTGSDE